MRGGWCRPPLPELQRPPVRKQLVLDSAADAIARLEHDRVCSGSHEVPGRRQTSKSGSPHEDIRHDVQSYRILVPTIHKQGRRGSVGAGVAISTCVWSGYGNRAGDRPASGGVGLRFGAGGTAARAAGAGEG